MNFLFFDFETLGRNVHDCAIIDMSTIVVNTERMLSTDPYTLSNINDVKRFKLSVEDQVKKFKWKVYEDTVQFWSTVSEKARKNISPKKDDLNVDEFVNDFITYLNAHEKIDYWWSRSNTFDPLLLWRIFDSVNKYNYMNEYLPFWKIRDIRTYIDSKLDFPNKNGFVPLKNEEEWNSNFVEHDSSWDVLADVLRMQAIMRAENDLEML